jgi:hypothetical protein
MAPEMRDREDDRALNLHDEKYAEGKPAEDRASNLAKDDWEALWPFFDSRERGPEFNEEFGAEVDALAFVPPRRIKRIELRLRPNREARHLPVVAKTFLCAVDDVFPGTRFVGSATVFRQTFFQKGLLPVLQRHLARRRGDAIPQRLHVFDLILDRQRVEPGRRQRHRAGHGRNIPPGPWREADDGALGNAASAGGQSPQKRVRAVVLD